MRLNRQLIQKQDEVPEVRSIQHGNRRYQESLRCGQPTKVLGSRPSRSTIQETLGIVAQGQSALQFGVAQIKQAVDPHIKTEYPSTDDLRRSNWRTVALKVPSIFGNRDTDIARQVECRLARHVPTIFVTASGITKVQHGNWGVGGKMTIHDSPPGSEVILQRHLIAGALVVGSQRRQHLPHVAPLHHL